MNRLVILPDETLEPHVARLRMRIESVARDLGPDNLADLLDPVAAEVFRTVCAPADCEMVLWSRAEGYYSAVWSIPEDLAARVTADVSAGLVSMVAESTRGAWQSEPELRVVDWTNLVRLRGREPVAMAGVPVTIAGKVVGVLSLVDFSGVTDEGVLRPLAHATEIFARLAEDRILRCCIGLENC